MTSCLRQRSAAIVVVVAVAVLLAACGDDGSGATGSRSTTAADQVSGTITVFAAASLTEAFGQIGTRFEHDHPSTTVSFDFGSSSALATQISQGAPADVFASADEANMALLTTPSTVVRHPTDFAHNRLAILVADGNPDHVTSLDDLADPELAVVLCAAQVPCGKYARQILSNAGVTVTPRSYEADVKGVVTKVATGDADAGIVYVTDARTAKDDTDSVAIPASQNAVATYPIAATSGSANPKLAAAFVDYVRGAAGQRVLERFGFERP
jgi:molybdate transport system substrate-binding protein